MSKASRFLIIPIYPEFNSNSLGIEIAGILQLGGIEQGETSREGYEIGCSKIQFFN